MEDYIIREVDKLRKMIEAILYRIGLLKELNDPEVIYEAVKIELLDKIGLNLDALLDREDFVDVLIREYGFNLNNLEKFAELLYDLIAASPDKETRRKLAENILSVYAYLDKNGTTFSLNRYQILKELEQYL